MQRRRQKGRLAFYNTERFHQALGNRTPMLVWREAVEAAAASSTRAVEMYGQRWRVDHADFLAGRALEAE